MEILKITEKPEIDESIEEYEYHSYDQSPALTLTDPGKLG